MSAAESEGDYQDENNASTNTVVAKRTSAKGKGSKGKKAGKSSKAGSGGKQNLNTTVIASANTKTSHLIRNDEKNVLITALLSHTVSVDTVANDLIDRHNTDANAAQCELVNALFRSVGGSPSCEINPSNHKLDDIDDDEWAAMITDVVSDMQNAHPSHVLLTAKKTTTKVAAKFLESFKNFWFSVADVALSEGAGASKSPGAAGTPTSARLDVELVKELILRVTELVGVGQPDIRFASSLATFEMARAVLMKIVSLSNNLAIAERQHAAATGKRKDSLKSQIDSLKKVISEMEELVTGPVYSVVFMHRYRDSNEYVRTLCLENLATSIILRPSLFLQDKYLKYFGWMLSDTSPEVRTQTSKQGNWRHSSRRGHK